MNLSEFKSSELNDPHGSEFSRDCYVPACTELKTKMRLRLACRPELRSWAGRCLIADSNVA